MNKLNGVTYYQLPKSEGYEGDSYKEKKSGLTGAEIDSNFLFLRGNDISDVIFSDDKSTLTFRRINGKEDLKIEHIDELFSIDESSYDSENGVLTLKVGDNTKTLNGFRDIDIEKTYYDTNSGILHLSINDKTMDIKGFALPSSLYLTGMLTPIKGILDDYAKLPLHNNVGDGYIIENTVNLCGNSYNIDALMAISNYLSKNSEWEIPTFEIWGKMLNAIELCDDDREHLSEEDDIDLGLGRYAGILLKDDTWATPEKEDFNEFYTFNALKTDYDSFEDIFYTEFAALGKGNGEFWGKMLKSFGENAVFEDINPSYQVYQRKINDKSDFLNLRLFKNGGLSLNGSEKIGNKVYKTCLMPYDEKNTDNYRLWTSVNARFTLDEIKPFEVEGYDNIQVRENEGKKVKEHVFAIWNGYKWEERIIDEGESFVMYNKDYERYEEYRIEDDKIIMVLENIYENIRKINEKFEDYYTKEEVDRKIGKNKVVEKLSDLTNPETWKDFELYNGFVVSVLEVSELKFLVNKDEFTKEESWVGIKGGGGGESYITEDIKAKDGTVIVPNGTTLTNAIAIIINLVNNSDGDIGFAKKNDILYLRINGISNE